MTEETRDRQGSDKKDDATKKDGSTVESKHTAENMGKTEGGLPGQGQKGENDREDSKGKAS